MVLTVSTVPGIKSLLQNRFHIQSRECLAILTGSLAAIVPVGTSFLTHLHCIMRGLVLGKSIDVFPSAAGTALKTDFFMSWHRWICLEQPYALLSPSALANCPLVPAKPPPISTSFLFLFYNPLSSASVDILWHWTLDTGQLNSSHTTEDRDFLSLGDCTCQ